MAENLRLKVLSEKEVSTIYEKCLHILANKGVKVDHQEGLKILDRAGAQVDFENQQVRFPKDIVEGALKSVPKSYKMADDRIIPNPEGMFYVNSDTGCTKYLEPETNTLRDVTLADVGQWAQIYEAMDQLDICSFHSAMDAPKETADVHGLRAVFENTNKHIMVHPYSFESLEYLFELMAVKAGGVDALKKKPITNVICCALSPLAFKRMDIEAIMYCCRYQQAVMIASLPSAGATAPITVAGEVLISAVEALSMLVISQLIEPGTPVIANPYLFALDMVTGKTLNATVEGALASTAVAQFFKDVFNVPFLGCGFMTDSYVPDVQCAMEETILMQLMAFGGCDVLCGAGSLGTSTIISPVKLMTDIVLANMVNRIISGVKVDEDTLAMQEILDVKPGGHFLESQHTLKHCREVLRPELFINLDPEAWKSAGSKDLNARALEKYKEVEKSLKPLELPEDVQKEFDRIVKQADKRLVK